MKRAVTLKENHEFRRLYQRGASAVGGGMVVYCRKNKLGHNRVGITTGTKIGKAHARSRARRVIREAYRLLMPRLKNNVSLDIVFVARVKTTCCPMQEVLKTMEKHLSDYLIYDEKDI